MPRGNRNRNNRYAPYLRVPRERPVVNSNPEWTVNLFNKMTEIIYNEEIDCGTVYDRLREMFREIYAVVDESQDVDYITSWTQHFAIAVSIADGFRRQNLLIHIYTFADWVDQFWNSGCWLMRFYREYSPLMASNYCSHVIPDNANMQSCIEDDGIIMPMWMFTFFKSITDSQWKMLSITHLTDLTTAVESFGRHHLLRQIEVDYLIFLLRIKIDLTRTARYLHHAESTEKSLRVFMELETSRFEKFKYGKVPLWVFPLMNEHCERWRRGFEEKLKNDNTQNIDIQLIEHMVRYSIVLSGQVSGQRMAWEQKITFKQLYNAMVADHPNTQTIYSNTTTYEQMRENHLTRRRM